MRQGAEVYQKLKSLAKKTYGQCKYLVFPYSGEGS